jgi:hypothetical protein
MIVEWLLGLGETISEWLAGLMTFEGVNPEAVWSQMSGLVAQFGSLGAWIAWGTIGTAVGVAISVWLVCLGIKVTRAVLAHVPQFGGAG